MNIKNKLEKIIPPNNFRYRLDFSNEHLIDELNDQEKKEIEKLLIKKLFDSPDDFLIIETLSYMRSENAIPAMRISLDLCENFLQKIVVAASIYKINHESYMMNIAIDAFEKLYKDIDLIYVFSYLKKFNSEKTDDLIKRYIDNPNFSVSYKAKRVLGMIKD